MGDIIRDIIKSASESVVTTSSSSSHDWKVLSSGSYHFRDDLAEYIKSKGLTPVRLILKKIEPNNRTTLVVISVGVCVDESRKLILDLIVRVMGDPNDTTWRNEINFRIACNKISSDNYEELKSIAEGIYDQCNTRTSVIKMNEVYELVHEVRRSSDVLSKDKAYVREI